MYVPEIESENVPLIEEALRRGICKPSNCSIVPSKIISNVPLKLARPSTLSKYCPFAWIVIVAPFIVKSPSNCWKLDH